MSYAALGLPGGEIVDKGIKDLANGTTSLESLLLSLAAPRLRREGVPITTVEPDPEGRLHYLLTERDGALAHERYCAWLRQIESFADACWLLRRSS